jgi:hypothetical protein
MKTVAKIIILLLCIALLYTTAMYGYVWMKMKPLVPIAPPSFTQSYAKRPSVHMVHAVNSVKRAHTKDKHYDGMEIDVFRKNGKLIAAHDEKSAEHAPTLGEIFTVLSHPETKTFWLDLKIDLTQADIEALKNLARTYHIHPRRMLFEVAPGATADLLNAGGFPILLQLPDAFHEDGGNLTKRQELNAQLEENLRRYRPFAVVGSFGKYPYLRAYFPYYNKAIYSSTTVRPSLKKYFLTKAMFNDPSVLIWMQDEYTFLPF